MKRCILLIALLASFWSCNKGDDIIELCDSAYLIAVVVKNETDKEIILTNKYPDYIDRDDATIATGGTYGEPFFFRLGPCDNKILLEDLFPEGDFRFYSTTIDTSVFRMTVDGEEVSDDIWLRKYWSYTPDYYVWTYSLTVTDELLADLSKLR